MFKSLVGGQRRVAPIGILLLVAVACLVAPLEIDRPPSAASREAAAIRAASRFEAVRQLFMAIKNRDPIEWDRASLVRWAESPLGTAQIAARLRAERPQVGAYYFLWYGKTAAGWGNDATSVPPGAPMPALGWYDSTNPGVIDTHISQMIAAGFDFVIVDVVARSSDSWARAQQFFDRRRGRPLKAAVMLDGLYDMRADDKALWVGKTVADFTTHPNYLRLHGGQPLIALFGAPVDFAEDRALLRNVYWTPQYTPGANTFNDTLALHAHDWPFWAPTPQPVMNGVVPVMPGYLDTHLGRERQLEHPRRDGQTYHEQWQRARAEVRTHPRLQLERTFRADRHRADGCVGHSVCAVDCLLRRARATGHHGSVLGRTT